MESNLHSDWLHRFIDTLAILYAQSEVENPLLLKTEHTAEFSEKTQQTLAETDVFIAVITENYYTCALCKQELTHYLKKKPDPSSVFKVLKKDVSAKKQPTELAQLPAYEFYEYDIDSEIIIEYNNTGRLPDYKYWVKLDDLVHGIIRYTEGKDQDSVGVYLASTTIDQKQVREALARNLKHQGFTIFPKESYSQDDPNLKEKIKTNLSKCALSMHLMGETFGEVMNEEGDSLVSLENEIALRYSLEHHALKRIIWVPRDLQVMETKQQTYLEYLRAHKELQSNSYYLETSLESLKAHMHELLGTPVYHQKASQVQRVFYASSGVNDGYEKVQVLLNDKSVELLTPASFKYWSEHQLALGDVDVLILMDVPHSKKWLQNWMKSLCKIQGYRTKKTKIQGVLISDEPSTLIGIKNLINFKVLSKDDFQQNPARLLDLM